MPALRTTQVRAGNRVILLRVLGIFGCIAGSMVGCGACAAGSSAWMNGGAAMFVVGLVCFITSRVIQA